MKRVICKFCEPCDYCLISVRHQIDDFIFVIEKGEFRVNSNKFLVKRQPLCFVNAAACDEMYFVINNFAKHTDSFIKYFLWSHTTSPFNFQVMWAGSKVRESNTVFWDRYYLKIAFSVEVTLIWRIVFSIPLSVLHKSDVHLFMKMRLITSEQWALNVSVDMSIVPFKSILYCSASAHVLPIHVGKPCWCNLYNPLKTYFRNTVLRHA